MGIQVQLVMNELKIEKCALRCGLNKRKGLQTQGGEGKEKLRKILPGASIYRPAGDYIFDIRTPETAGASVGHHHVLPWKPRERIHFSRSAWWST